jgi:putative ABC transport system permease protein
MGVRANRFRSLLTTLGIVIGVASVVAVVSIIQGMSLAITKNFDDLGSNSLTIHSDTSFEEQLQGKVNRLTLRDYDKLTRHLRSAGEITPSFSPFGVFGTTIRSGGRTAFTRVSAVTANYQDTFQTYSVRGRFLTGNDDTSRRRVAVVGEKLRDNLGLGEEAVGSFIEIGGEAFKVVGVMEPRGDLFGISQDDYVLIPFSTGQSLAGNDAQQDITINLNVADLDQIAFVQDRAEQILRDSRKLKPGEDNDFKVQTAQQLRDSFSKVTDTVTVVFGGVVGISLLVGGIGIMNIMLVSVTERTREIGICMALGAQRRHILMQFLIEAVILSLIGGVIGLVLGTAIGFGATKVMPGIPGAVVPFWAAATALGFSAAMGIVFGVIPAAKAAGLNPVEALRFE